MQAEILASYKPKLNVKRLISTLDHVERLVANTLQNFKGTRHMVVYYEDLVQNQTVSYTKLCETDEHLCLKNLVAVWSHFYFVYNQIKYIFS